jgi:hypothetical protein
LALTPTEIIFRTGPPAQETETTRSGLTLVLPENLSALWLAHIDDAAFPTSAVVDRPTSLQQWIDEAVVVGRRTSVEARVIRTSQDEEFDVSLIRDNDLLQ